MLWCQSPSSGVPRETQLTGRGVSYCALCDGNFFRDQVVAVVGGGNSALEEALYLSRIASKLYLIHRREGFRAAKVYQDKIRAASDKIELVLDTVVTGLMGEDSLQGLYLKNVKSGEETQLPVDGMFVFVGYEPQNSFLPAGLELDPQGFIITDCEMRTNLPGLFAAGDIRSKMCRQVTTAVGDGELQPLRLPLRILNNWTPKHVFSSSSAGRMSLASFWMWHH